MGKRRKRRKRRGHFCWVCERIRPNERFTGRGHARHVCRDCAKLGSEELAFRQQIRNLEQCFDFGLDRIRRKQRATFARYLVHDDARVRARAVELQQQAERRRWDEDEEDEEDDEYDEVEEDLWQAEEEYFAGPPVG